MKINEKKDLERGVTLIALIITIIVLLILAGVSLSALVGDSGIINKGQKSSLETSKSRVKEEIELKISETQLENDGVLNKDDILNSIFTLDGLDAEKEGDTIVGEYKNYFFQIDENNQVIIGDRLEGDPSIKGEVNIISNNDGTEEKEIQVVVEGDVKSVEAVAKNGLCADFASKSDDNIYTFYPTINGEYWFKIVSNTGRSIRLNCNITKAVPRYDDILNAIENINDSGVEKIRVWGKKNDGSKEMSYYTLNVICCNGDLTVGDTLTSNGSAVSLTGLAFSNTTLTCGVTSDVGNNTVVLKINGDLNIGSGKTITSIISSNNGPKGMIIYCTGNLTNNGTISMTGKGSTTGGQNVYLFRNENESFEYIPSVGGSAGAANSVGGRSSIRRGLAGGGGGNGYKVSNAGSAGTSWGSGYGGSATSSSNNTVYSNLKAGLLVIYSDRSDKLGNINSNGLGGYDTSKTEGNAASGGTGGGSVNIFLNTNDNILSFGGLRADAGAAGSAYYRTAKPGGVGRCCCGVIGSGTYSSLYED